MSSEDYSKLKYPDYWNRDFNAWGNLNDWDIYWIEKQTQPTLITKHNSHVALGDELRCLKKIYTSTHPAYNKIRNLKKGLKGSINEFILQEDNSKKGIRDGLKIARKGFQIYSKMDFESVERERKRLKKHAGNSDSPTMLPNVAICDSDDDDNEEIPSLDSVINSVPANIQNW
ncbi:4536_t:CDS:2, partial [Acaulospora morrowiae]